MSDDHTESELKVPVGDLESLRRLLAAEGGVCVVPCQREVNLLFDHPDGRLKAADRALRLRRFGGRFVLTYKGAASYLGQVRQREELEVEVEDGGALVAILERLDLRPCLRYEKDRELWLLDTVEVALDHTPLGSFVELEGDPQRLQAVAPRLGLEPSAAVRGSYVSLWERHRQLHPELPVDMVFPASNGR